MRSNAAELDVPVFTRTLNTANSSAAKLSLAEPAGVWFSMVHSWIEPSPRSSNDPVPKRYNIVQQVITKQRSFLQLIKRSRGSENRNGSENVMLRINV